MAIFHLSIKTVSRSRGQSTVITAAYQSGEKLYDERAGLTRCYSHKERIEGTRIILPMFAPKWGLNREKLWNAAEAAEKRKDACVGREILVALPAELSPRQREELVFDFVGEIVSHIECAADLAIHAPDKRGDQRNFHAHILLSTRIFGPTGFGKKTRELDVRHTASPILLQWRELWANLTNNALEQAGHEARVDHRSLAERGIDRIPGIHLGPGAIGFERRTGQPSRRRLDYEKAISEQRGTPHKS